MLFFMVAFFAIIIVFPGTLALLIHRRDLREKKEARKEAEKR